MRPAGPRRTATRPRRWREDLVDAAGVAALTGIALSAFTGTFDGGWWVLTAAVGVVVGILLALALTRWRLPWYAAVPGVLLALAILGPPLTLRGSASGSWPTPAAWAELGSTATQGWRGLLTTLPPVDGAGRLSFIALVLALVGACAGMLIAQRSPGAHRPVLAPALVGAAGVLLGVTDPGGVLVRALAALAVTVGWGAARRRRTVLTRPGTGARRAVAGAILLGVVGAVVALAEPLVTGPGERVVLREHIDPPLDLTDRPSPLAAYRVFRPVAQDLDEEVLVQVTGLPEGTLLRLATVDTYSGTVWAAGTGRPDDDAATSGDGAFLRVGARIPRPAGGASVTAEVTVGPAWAAHRDLRIWVPTLGHETRLAFTGPGARERAEELRYNLDTGAAIVPGGLTAGQRYTLEDRVPASGDDVAPAAPAGGVAVPAELSAVTAGLVAASGDTGGAPLEQVRAVGARLRSVGAYSDGGAGAETILPGHGLGRLKAFLGEPEPAGNDEQYAAALALAAAYLGVPSRVVLAAVPGADGVVTGADVRAWVEVWSGSRWALVPPDDFVPPRDKKPRPQALLEQDRSDAAVVPPPNALRPPGSEDGFTLDESESGRTRSAVEDEGFSLPVWAKVVLGAAGFPLVAVFLWTLFVVLAKVVRRGVRTRRGGPSQRASAAWDDVIDTLRDNAWPVSRQHTRREVARLAGAKAVTDAAAVADEVSYGPDPADDDDADRVWSCATRVRQEQSAAQGLRRRWLAAVSLASVLPGRAKSPRRTPSSIHDRRVVDRLVLSDPAGVATSGGPVAGRRRVWGAPGRG